MCVWGGGGGGGPQPPGRLQMAQVSLEILVVVQTPLGKQLESLVSCVQLLLE